MGYFAILVSCFFALWKQSQCLEPHPDPNVQEVAHQAAQLSCVGMILLLLPLFLALLLLLVGNNLTWHTEDIQAGFINYKGSHGKQEVGKEIQEAIKAKRPIIYQEITEGRIGCLPLTINVQSCNGSKTLQPGDPTLNHILRKL